MIIIQPYFLFQTLFKFLILLGLFTYSIAHAEEQLISEGFEEVVLITADNSQWHRFFTHHAGWQKIDEGISDENWMTYWGLDNYHASYELYQNPGSNKGRVRVLKFTKSDGYIAPTIRSHSQSWDTGGIFDFNLRIKDLEHTKKYLTLDGWKAPTDPIEFRFGKFHVKEWLPIGPDGVQLALIERIDPPLEGWPYLKKMSRSFNATMIVDDLSAAEKFWRDMLGFKSYLYHKGASPEPGKNVLGLPHNLATTIQREVHILHPTGKNDGSIELLKFHGATGYDFSTESKLPNRGISSLRFPAKNISKLIARAHTFGIKPYMIGKKLPFMDNQSADFVAFEAPGGAIIEFFQILND